ncbi:4-(cytidine 5'-diphospho)-2-C-methyl-D-erythritol kinase [Novosphingobium sp.]|uniref:4-(cytidine 5'-diphospho)-2-C-methyl-D-erythritol kinase n=1 Tax=Novosphingobium sp. TaxID=1874826 RepID=UPI003D121857
MHHEELPLHHPADGPPPRAGEDFEIGYAKINLALHVRSRRADGYHELETLFAFVDSGDVLCAVPAAAFSLQITGPFAADLAGEGDNLVLRAAKALADDRSPALAFTLDKRLPIASGIGGGSADAGAAIRLARRIWGANGAATDLARLGADVPACIASRTCFGTGVGDRLTDIDLPGLAGTSVLLVNPRLACPTGPVFRAWDGVDRGPLDPADWRTARNDLEAPAVALVPEIGAVLAELRQTGAQTVRMSGSGATCYALYGDAQECDAAAARIAARQPGWWALRGVLR